MHKQLDKNNVESILPLTAMQKGLLYHYLQNRDSEQYFEQLSINVSGNVDYFSFKNAWSSVIKSNEILRSVFRWEKLSNPVCVVLREIEIPIQRYDFSSLNKESALIKIEELKVKDRIEKIDISTEPFRINLCKLSNNEFEIIISHHHILYDGWSNGIIVKEFMEAYNSIFKNEKRKLVSKGQFREFIELCNKEDTTTALDYWKAYLDGIEAPTPLPSYKRNNLPIKSVASFKSVLPDELDSKVKSFAKMNKYTVATVMYAAWSILLYKYSHSKDILFGTTVSGRNVNLDNIENTVGLFINTVPLRVQISGNESINNILINISKMLLNSEAYSHTPLYEIKSKSKILGNENIFNSIIAIENYPLSQELNDESELKINSFSTFEMTNYDLTLAIEAFGQIKTNFIYDAFAFDSLIIKNMCDGFNIILEAIVNDMSIKIDEIDILLNEEKNKIVNEFNPKFTSNIIPKTVKQLFEEQVLVQKGRTALVYKGKEVSYIELNEKSNQLAHHLREKGVKANDIVGLLVNQSIEMIIGIMGIIKAGGAYLPLDPKSPVNRIVDILEDSRTTVLVTESDLNTGFVSEVKHSIQKIFLDVDNEIQKQNTCNLKEINKPSDLIYTMYTSGSTGNPKGTLTSNINIIRTVKDTNYIDINEDDVLLQLSNYSFDGSSFDIFGSLLNGAKLVLVDKETQFDTLRLAKLIEEEKITIFFITTVLFNTLIDFNVSCLKNVRKVLSGGERVSYKHMEKALNFMGEGKILHVYGPTENTIFTTFYELNSMDENIRTVPIGKPISNTKIYILNKMNQIVPVGVPGDIYVSGDGLIKGYLNRPDLTEEKFIRFDKLFSKNDLEFLNLPNGEKSQVIYKTGDYGKWLSNGDIEFLDRVDNQVKLRGFRIELGEIENEILKYTGINNTFVTTIFNDNGDKNLCAYLITKEDIDISELRTVLQKRLPFYMIPQFYVILNKFPFNKNGKIDVNRLPKPIIDNNLDVEFEEPKDETEKKLQAIWENVLGIERIGVNDSFFALGGHSIKATIIASYVYKEFDVQIPLGELFKLSTIRLLANYLKIEKKENISVFGDITKVNRDNFLV